MNTVSAIGFTGVARPCQQPAGPSQGDPYRNGGRPEGWAPGEHFPDTWTRRFGIDFVGGELKASADKGIEPVITLSSGKVSNIEILYVKLMDGYRILFDWTPTNDAASYACTCVPGRRR